MRRIPLALALVGAVAVTGCMSGGKSSAGSNDSGVQKGVTGSYYFVNIFQPPVGGIVTSDVGGINCGAATQAVSGTSYVYTYYAGASACGTAGQTQLGWSQVVTLTAVAQGTNVFVGWAGDCAGMGATCTLSTAMNGADKTVVAIFGAPGTAGHGNFMDPAVHAKAFGQFASGDTAALKCNGCHGPTLEGLAIAPSCFSCHDMNAVTSGGHGDATAEAWGDHGGWSAACQRCHTNQGYQDRMGFDAGAGVVAGGAEYNLNPYTASIDATLATPPLAAGYTPGPLKCGTCHNAVTDPWQAGVTTIVFPSAISNASTTVLLGVVTADKVTALCGSCHMGRESTTSINTKIGATAIDTVIGAPAGISFVNPHYLGAAATVFGTEAKGWAEYPTKQYTGANTHGETAGKCSSCHDPHTQAVVEVKASSCGRCHFNETTGLPVASFAELEESRQFGFEGDIDGDTIQESLKAEIEGLEATLTSAITAYSRDVVGTAACYGAAYPYFMIDVDANGACDATETTAFKLFTPRLLRAAFNLKWAHAEPGAWAHNPRYAIEILFDAITDLNAGLTAAGKTPVAFAGKRSFNGHFGGARAAAPYAAFLYTTGTGFTSNACMQCHGGQKGFEAYLAAPLGTTLNKDTMKVTGMQCSVCHSPAASDTNMKTMRSDVTALYFPPQKSATATPNPGLVTISASTLPAGFAVCATCHSGRENGKSVDNAIATNYALSTTGLVATGGTISTATIAAPAAWSKDRFRNAKVTFTAGLNAGTTVIASTTSASTAAGQTVTFTLASALANAVVAGDTFDVTFDASTFGLGFTNPHYLGAAAIVMGSDAGMMYQYAGKTYQAKPINWGSPYGSPHGASCTGCHKPVASKHTFEVDLAACATCHAGGYALAPKKLEIEELATTLYASIQAYATAAGYPVCYNGASHPYWFVPVGATCPTTTQARFDAKGARAAFNFKWAEAEPGGYAHNLEYMGQALCDSIVDLGGTCVRP